MPTQSRGFFACDFCGLQHDTEEEAREHEVTQCPRRRPLPGTAPLPPSALSYQQQQQQRAYFLSTQGQHPPFAAMGPMSVAETEGYHFSASAAGVNYFHHPPMMGNTGGPENVSGGSGGKEKATLLLSRHERDANLTREDNVACQNIEIFEATSDIIAEYESMRRQSPHGSSSTSSTPTVAAKQVGLRCVHCTKFPQSAPLTTMTAKYRTVFPPSIASMADHIRSIAKYHLSSCRMAPPDVQEVCQVAVAKPQYERGEHGVGGDVQDDARAALIDFCVGFCQQMGIVNRQQHKSGMEYIEGGAGSRPSPYQQYPQSMMGGGPTPSSFRAGGRDGYPKQPPPPYGISRGMGPVVGPGDQSSHIAPTPLHRTRDRQFEGELPPSTVGTSPSTTGYPTPFSTQPLKEESASHYDSTGGEIPTPAQPNFERRESVSGGSTSYPTPGSGTDNSPRGDYHDQQQYDLPSNFPFYQERDRSWHCKFCASVPPQFRDPHPIWSSRDGGPPPGSFIDQHLSMCRGYQQGYVMPPSGMVHTASGGFAGFPPPFGGWDPAHLPYPPQEYQYGFPSPQMLTHLEPNIATSGRFMSAEHEQESRGSYAASRTQSTRTAAQPTAAASADAINHAMSYLEQFDKDYYERDPEHATIPKLVLGEDRLLLTDYFFFLMKQLRLCRFSEADRKTRGGKREKIRIGYGGLQCIHCADLPMSRKFFWSNVDRLANSFAEIPGHILKCKRCPPQSKDALIQLKQSHPEQMAKLPRGSQKVFFRRMWARLHDDDPRDDDDEQASTTARSGVAPESAEISPRPTVSTKLEKNSPESQKSSDISPSSGQSEETALVIQRTAKEAAEALSAAANETNPPSPSSRVLLAIPEDKEWLSEKDIFIRKQLEVFCATEEDVAAASADLKYPVSVGQVGIRCIHCALVHGSDAAGHATAYPFTISGIHESVREIHRLHLDSCKNLPAAKKAKLENLGASSLSSVLRRYYILGAKALGLRDTKSSGIRSGGESSPIGSQAAFTFAETEGEEDIDRTEVGSDEKEEATDAKPRAEGASEGKTPESSDSTGAKRSTEAAGDVEPPNKVLKTE